MNKSPRPDISTEQFTGDRLNDVEHDESKLYSKTGVSLGEIHESDADAFNQTVSFVKGSLYNKIPTEYADQYYNYFNLEYYRNKFNDAERAFRIKYARDHPVSFAYWMLGIKLRMYQAYAIDCMLHCQKVALCFSRRSGKSTLFSLLAFWSSYFNKYPKNAIERFTEIGLVSKEELAAKKLLSNVREMIHLGDINMMKLIKSKMGKDKITNYFSRNQCKPDTSEQLTWSNGSMIRSLPPTKKVRQFGFSILFIDEIAFMEPRDNDPDTYYNTVCVPTVADTMGRVVIASTPNGKDNLFATLFDPDDKHGTDFTRLWFTWEIADGDTDEEVRFRQFVTEEKLNLERQGKGKLFNQEYLADFTIIQSSFYEYDDVIAYFEDKLAQHYEWNKSPCSIGFDGGISDCQTVLTVKTKYRGKILRLYHRVFPKGYDINQMWNSSNDDGWQRLCERYDVQWIVPDDCAQLSSHIAMLKSQGYACMEYSFTNVQNKNKAFYNHRTLLKTGNMLSYPDDELKREMMGLQEERLIRHWSIHKPTHGSDDIIDSDIFATVPFFDDDDAGFGAVDVVSELSKDDKIIKQEIDTSSRASRLDNDWLKLQGGLR